jgi:hypothetical protein|tara:strand:- start:4521 stop:4766 length:246 start_codon:yes stop_codon:yes gene_type:complete
MSSYTPQMEKICCEGEGEQPRHTRTRSFCPVCHRPVEYKVIQFYSERDRKNVEMQMVKRHRSDGIKSCTRIGIPNKKVTTQ